MAATSGKGRVLTVTGHGLLFAGDRAGGFERNPGGDVLAVADAALDATAVVGRGADASVVADHERIIVGEAAEASAGETTADLDTLRRRKRHECACENSIELVEDRFAEAGRNVAGDRLDDTAERIAVAAGLLDRCGYPGGGVRVGAAGRIGFNLRKVDGGSVDGGVDVSDLIDPSEHLNPRHLCQELPGDRRSRDPADGLAG